MSRGSSIDAKADAVNESLTCLTVADVTSPPSVTPSSPRCDAFTPSSFTSMKYRNLGKSGIKVPVVGLALWNAFGCRMTEQTADELVSTAYDHHINYFDTGDAFVNGRSELLLGSILKKKNWKRSTYIISSKIFWTSGPTAFTPAAGLSRKFIIEAVEASLARLQLSYIDLVLINKLDGMCPLEEIVRAMQHILDKGKIMYWGTCRWSPVHIMEAFTVARQFNLTPPAVEQMEYHMFSRDKMELYMPELYHKLGVGVISWSPHSLHYDDGIQLISRRAASAEDKAAKNSKQQELNPITSRLGCDHVQLSTAWSLRNDNTNCVLIAPRSVDKLYLHLNSLKILPKLNLPLMEEIDKILDNKPALRKVQGSTSTSIRLDVASAVVGQEDAAV